jgi:CDP-paratose 2-epimerase
MTNKTVLIIGGAGFIGSNAANHFLKQGNKVIVFDNLSRGGSKKNAAWLREMHQTNLSMVEGDIRHDQEKLLEVVKQADLILHLAAQVAVTTSVVNPREDFDINALGTFNVLEAVREAGHNPILIYSSTNKVYGGLEDVAVVETETDYKFKDLTHGVPETHCLDFHSPYGCSKGTADQYVRDYNRIYGIPTIVFRQSCIYGPHQFGVEDQGWVAWFLIALSQNKPITIYGNGKQVRDLLFIDDLVRAYEMAADHIDVTKGQIYNIGGGANNTLSVWLQFRPILEKLFNRTITAQFAETRPGDQPIFVADIRKAQNDFNWQPKVSVQEGITLLHTWVSANPEAFSV